MCRVSAFSNMPKGPIFFEFFSCFFLDFLSSLFSARFRTCFFDFFESVFGSVLLTFSRGKIKNNHAYSEGCLVCGALFWSSQTGVLNGWRGISGTKRSACVQLCLRGAQGSPLKQPRFSPARPSPLGPARRRAEDRKAERSALALVKP